MVGLFVVAEACNAARMRETEEFTEAERQWLAERCPKALRIVDAQDARLKAFEKDVGYYVGKLDRIDALPGEWTVEPEPGEGSDVEPMTAADCAEELEGILGGYRERVARLRADGWTLPSKDEKPKAWAEEMGNLARDLAKRQGHWTR